MEVSRKLLEVFEQRKVPPVLSNLPFDFRPNGRPCADIAEYPSVLLLQKAMGPSRKWETCSVQELVHLEKWHYTTSWTHGPQNSKFKWRVSVA